MKKLITILIILFAALCCAKVGDITKVKPTDITVKSKVVYTYEAKLPDGTTQKIETSSAMTDKQIQEQAADLYDAEQVKIKEIETKIETLKYKQINYKEWVINGKIIAYRYRYELPDGTTNWIDSKVPLKEADCLSRAKVDYKVKLTEAGI